MDEKKSVIRRQPEAAKFTDDQWSIIEKGNLEKEKKDFLKNPPKKNKSQMQKKIFYISDDLNHALIKYLAYERVNGRKVTWQSLIEGFLEKELKAFKS